MNQKVLIICYCHLSSDPRVQRQIKALKDNFDLEVCGLSDSGNPSIPFHPIYDEPPFSITRKLKRIIQFITHKFDLYYWDSGKKSVVEALRKNNYAAIVANDIQTLPLALAIVDNHSRIYFDAHEYHPREFEDLLRWRLLNKPYIEFLCKKYIPQVSAFSTVSEAIAMEYHKYLGKKPFVITNGTDYQQLQPTLGSTKTIRIIHHTAAIRSRKIELMLQTMDLLDERFELDLILVGSDVNYIKELKKLAETKTNIRFLPPVPFKEICCFINTYDIGMFILPPTNFNYLNALPNKLFEFVQARLALAVSPNPEMASLVKKHDLGIVADDYTAVTMANALNKITKKEIMHYKMQSELHAKKLSAEENMKKINEIVSALILQ